MRTWPGFRWGGAIAQELALARPDLVSSLALVGTWCRTDAHIKRIFESWGLMARNTDDEPFVRSLFLWVYTRRAHLDGMIEHWVGQALEEEHPQTLDAFLRTLDAIIAHDTADRVNQIEGPALVIGGDRDMIFAPEVQRDLAERLRHSRFELMEGEAHQPFQEASDRFNDLLAEFFESAERHPTVPR